MLFCTSKMFLSPVKKDRLECEKRFCYDWPDPSALVTVNKFTATTDSYDCSFLTASTFSSPKNDDPAIAR